MNGTLHEALEKLIEEAEQVVESSSPQGRKIRCLGRDLELVRPGVLFYGFYNHGKSTIINALLGVEKAEVRDAPCTDRVSAYRWQNIDLYDSAGIDAPIAHEEVTNEHLARFQAVAFVISTAGGSEEERTIREIERLLLWKKDLLIILNNKSGLDFSKPDEQKQAIAEMARLRDALFNRVSWPDNRRPRIILVNARTALKARLENKPALYAMSGMPDVEQSLREVFDRANGGRLLTPIIERLDRWLDETEKELTGAQSNRNERLSEMLNDLAKLRRTRADLMRCFTADLSGMIGHFTGRFVARVEQGESLEPEMDKYIHTAGQLLQRRLQDAADDLGVTLDTERTGFDRCAEDSRSYGTADFSGSREPRADSKRSGTEFQSSSRDLVRRLDPAHVGDAIRSQQGAEAIRSVLLKLRSAGIPGIKGRWTFTLTRWSKDLARGVGSFVQVALMVWQYREAQRAQKEYEDMMIRRHQAVVAEMQGVVQHLQTTVLNQAFEELREAFRPAEVELESCRSDAQEGSNAAQQALLVVARLRDELDRLKNSFT